MEDKFWMVWCPIGRPPVVKHRTYEAAMTEAKRLTKLTPDQKFYVLEMMGVASATVDVTYNSPKELVDEPKDNTEYKISPTYHSRVAAFNSDAWKRTDY